MNESRNHIVKFRVDDFEFNCLNEKMRLSKCKNMSDYLRRISLGGRIVNVDTSEFIEMKKLIRNISDNINQITKLANTQKSIYKDDIDEKYEDLHSSELKKFHKAGQYLTEKFPDKKLPKEEALQKQKTELIEQRNTANSEYIEIKNNIKDLDYARTAVQDYLKNEREAEQQKSKKKNDLE